MTGYLIYLDAVLHYDSRMDSTLNSFTFVNLSVGQTYSLGVSAVNDIGEGPKAIRSELAASVPMKLNPLTFVSSTATTIILQAPLPSFDGGQALTSYAFRRDDGPSTDFLSQQTQTASLSTFTWTVTTGKFYRFQVAGINSIGQGEWSDNVGFFIAGTPSDVQNLHVVSQS